jgi:hypothetical protein
MYANLHLNCISLLCSIVSSRFLYMRNWLIISQVMSAYSLAQARHQSNYFPCWSMKIQTFVNVHSSCISLLYHMVRSTCRYTYWRLTIGQLMSTHPSSLAECSANSFLCWRIKIWMFANVHSICISPFCSIVSSTFLYMHGRLNISQIMFAHPSALAKCFSNSCLCWRMEIHMFANVHSRYILLLCSTVGSQLLYMCSGWPSIRWRPQIHLLGRDIVQSSFYAGGWRLGCTPMCTWNEYSSYGIWLAPILLYTLGELTIEKMMSVHPSALAKHSLNSCLCWRIEIQMFAKMH